MVDTPIFTILGASGFIGRALATHLSASGRSFSAVTRANPPPPGAHLGHAIYAIGLTADFRSRPFDTVAAHVSRLAEFLEACTFDSFLYLSSTRLYRGALDTNEVSELRIAPADPDRLYDATKLAGEALCLAMPNPAVRVARLSNVYGAGDRSANFLTQVLEEARSSRSVMIRTSPSSAKDYLHVDDACYALCEIATKGRERIYNVASGSNVANSEIAALVERHTGAKVQFERDATEIIFPKIDVRRLASEIAWRPRSLPQSFPDLLSFSAIGPKGDA
jgi:nucleoside-diphosphate-sugar epimerase